VLLPIAALFLIGSLSYTVVEDVIRHRRFVSLALDTKLVLVTTAALTGLGTVALLFTERENPRSFGDMEPGVRVLNAFFQTVSRTAGFSSVDIGALTESGLFVLMALMFIGGSAASTAGGIKVQTFALLFFAIVAAVRGLDQVEAFRRRVPMAQVLRALSIALLSIAVVFVVALALNVAEGFVFHRVLFEAISALATVGYSTGITPETTTAGRLLLILSMFVGRLGPLTLVLALAARTRRTTYGWAEETIKIG
jgi:trk system potassium uptake protein TrkH